MPCHGHLRAAASKSKCKGSDSQLHNQKSAAAPAPAGWGSINFQIVTRGDGRKCLIPLATEIGEYTSCPSSSCCPNCPASGSCSRAKSHSHRQRKICQRLLHSARCFIRFPVPGRGRKKFNQRYKLIPREFIKFSQANLYARRNKFLKSKCR